MGKFHEDCSGHQVGDLLLDYEKGILQRHAVFSSWSERKLTLLAVFHQRGVLDGYFHGFFRAKTTPKIQGDAWKVQVGNTKQGGFTSKLLPKRSKFMFSIFFSRNFTINWVLSSARSKVCTARLLIIALGAAPLIARFLYRFR